LWSKGMDHKEVAKEERAGVEESGEEGVVIEK
jgi:hypothetical protein